MATKDTLLNSQVFIVNPVYNFGFEWADGGTVAHTFRLVNKSQDRIEIVSMQATTPCCSSITSDRKTVEKEGEASMNIVLKKGLTPGHKRLQFKVHATKGKDETDLEMMTIIDLYQDWQVSSDPVILACGESRECLLTVTCRTSKVDGSEMPRNVQARAFEGVRYVGETRAKQLPGGVTELTRQLGLHISAQSKPGNKSGEIVFEWANGHKKSHTIKWTVQSVLVATPAMLTIKRGTTQAYNFVVKSDRSFRLLSVKGMGVKSADFEKSSSTRHVVNVEVDGKGSSGDIRDIDITTDHPIQPQAKMSILILQD